MLARCGEMSQAAEQKAESLCIRKQTSNFLRYLSSSSLKLEIDSGWCVCDSSAAAAAARGRESKLSSFLPLIYSIYTALCGSEPPPPPGGGVIFHHKHTEAKDLKIMVTNGQEVRRWTDELIDLSAPAACLRGKF